MNMNDILNCTNIGKSDLDNAKLLVKNKIKELRDCTPNVKLSSWLYLSNIFNSLSTITDRLSLVRFTE